MDEVREMLTDEGLIPGLSPPAEPWAEGPEHTRG